MHSFKHRVWANLCWARCETGSWRRPRRTLPPKRVLEHRPVVDGQRVTDIYRRSVMLASGRYAMLDDGMSFSLVPWRPVTEQRLGHHIAAMVLGGGVS